MRSRFMLLLVAAIASLAVVLAWDKQDHEIFDLVSALEAAEGKGTDFYTFVGVDPAASVEVINKAYRRRSLALHPDKNPGVKDIQARFARLGVITNILRDPVKRERYNFFYKNGVPVWRGTGYYYSRFRPSLIHVLAFLVLVSTGVHWLILRMNHARDRRRIDYFVRAARGSGSGALTGTGTGTPSSTSRAGAANGSSGVASDLLASAIEQVNGSAAGNGASVGGQSKTRRERRAEKRGGGGGDKGSTDSGAMTPVDRSSAASGAPRRRKVRVPLVEGTSVAEGNGRALDLVVVGDEVFIPEEDGHLTPIEALARAPTIQALWPVKVGQALSQRIQGALFGGSKQQSVGAEADDLDDSLEETSDGSEAAASRQTKRATPNAGGAARGQATKVAGMRRRK